MEELNDLKNTSIYKYLLNLLNDNTIDPDTFDKFNDKLSHTYQYYVKFKQTEKVLNQNLIKVKEEMTRTSNEVNMYNQHQNDITDHISKFSEECRKARADISEYETNRIAIKLMEIDQKKELIEELKFEIQKKDEERKDKELNEINSLNEQIKNKIANLKEIELEIESKEKEIKEIEVMKESIDQNNSMKRNTIREINEQKRKKENKIHNEKITIEQNLGAEKKLEKENKDQLEQIHGLQNSLDFIIKDKNEREIRLEQLERDVDYDLPRERNKLKKEEDELEKKKNELDLIMKNNVDDKINLSVLDKNKQKLLNSKKEILDRLKKNCDTGLSELKDKENNYGRSKTELEQEINNLKDFRINKQGLLKDLNRILSNIQRLNKENEKNLNEKSDKEEFRKKLEGHLDVEKGEAKKLEERKEKLLQKLEQIKDNITEMKNLRETIIRTVSRLEESTRSINDEIQIKELAYLDLTKRHEELKSLYQKYHKFYETVLAERNKNVSKIHIAHQKKAEFKEKMRILTTEMDILQAELNDTNNVLLEKQKELTEIKQQQTTLKQDINKKQYEYKENEQEIKKLTNENEKLHTMLSTLENEMVNLRVDYELACESRNYTGIQLIDRNDELCIFYEKVQHLENQINETNKVIIAKETIVNKLKLNNNEVERFIEVNRKKMPQIPELSNKIKELDNEIKILNITLEKLISQIEDPTDIFKKELPGEDPDIDYLKMKYDQLAYMLNNKKEILLEKELINEEINDIAEKLKSRALNERERNLEINEKINEYEMKHGEIMRKNIASTSELSIFKAMLMNLQKTKDEKEKLLEAATEKLKNNEPPLEECINQWNSMIKLESHRKEYLDKRKRAIYEKENLPIEIPLRRKPEERPSQYQDDKTGFYLAYGKNSPFKNYASPSNMKYYKNVKLNKIENNKKEGEYNQLVI